MSIDESQAQRALAENLSCSGGTCSYIESGDLPTGGSGVNDGCPWGDDNCYLDKLETYYVTAVYDNGSGGKSGESPRSALVFWNCSEFNGIEEGYTGLIDARPRVPAWFEREAFEESPILLADSRPAECPVEPVAWPLAESPQLVLARPLTLGTVDPPYEVLDLHVDHLGSTRLMTDDLVTSTVRHDFFPFGEEMSPVLDLGSAKRFTGHERDRATGLDYMFARYYGSNLARFLSVDPVGGTAAAPQSWNRYPYTGNNPVNFVDPKGTCRRPGGWAGVGICAEAFIAGKRIGGIGRGDNRGHVADDPKATFRVQVLMRVVPESGKIVGPAAAAGVSKTVVPGLAAKGTATADLSNVQTTEEGSTTFTLTVAGTNGFGEGLFDPINFTLNMEVTKDGQVLIAPGSTRDGYPSVSVYAYAEGEEPVTLYEGGESSPSDLKEPEEEAIPPTERGTITDFDRPSRR